MAWLRSRAPARICLVGEDLDWIDGRSIQAAITRGIEYIADWVLDPIEVHVTTRGTVDCDLRWPYARGALPSWARLATAVPDSADAAVKRPRRVVINATVPWRAGLASSASVAVAVCKASSPSLSGLRLAESAFHLESRKLGRRVGPMDHLPIALGGVVSATFADNAVLDTAILSWPRDLAVVIVDTLTSRDTSEVIKSKAAKIASRESGAMRYVSRTRALAEALNATLAAGDPAPLDVGHLVGEAHASMRDDLGVSTPLIEECIRRLQRAGCLGAKISGTGHGGCIFALVEHARVQAMIDSVARLPVRAFTASVSPSAAVDF